MLRSLTRTSVHVPHTRTAFRPVQCSHLGLNLSRQLSTQRHPFATRRLGNALQRFVQDEIRRPNVFAAGVIGGQRQFHVSRPNQGWPVIGGLLASVLKTSTALEFARTAVRVAVTFIPLLLLKNHKTRRKLRHAETTGQILGERDVIVKRMRTRTILFHTLLFTPILIFWATILASLERTPLTGRWRLILLSPEEEDQIAAQLAGSGWFAAVGDILTKDSDSSPNLILPDDWRYKWVQDTLRRLESVIPILQREKDLEPKWLECGPDDIPLPPPAEYPLRPRPRGSEYLRRFAEMGCARTVQRAPHAITGPPYSLMVVDKPDSSNAFSYGFGPDGGGGIVVFSGFLEDILRKHQPELNTDHHPTAPAQPASWWSSLFGGIFSFSASTPPSSQPQFIPTEEQTSELAILLAHELSHLILAHHLETLSSSSVIYPGVMSIVTDILRALVFPITMLFGPFINDALAGAGKVGTGEFAQIAQYCTSQKQEVEADIVSARLLAHAGFDPRHTIHFWEDRHEDEHTAECTPNAAKAYFEERPMRWMGSSHPINEVRVAMLKAELERWESLREEARMRIRAEKQASSSS